MTTRVQPISITKNDLIKDYINYLLVIALSCLVHYDAQELVQSIWFYTCIIFYLIIIFQIMKYCYYKIQGNFLSKDYLKAVISMVIFGCFCGVFFMGLLQITQFFNNVIYPIADDIYEIKDVKSYILFIPCVIYYNRKNFNNKYPKNNVDVKKELESIMIKLFLLLWKLGFVLIFSLILSLFFAYLFHVFNERILFLIVYTLFFFPFVKTYKFLRQKKEAQ